MTIRHRRHSGPFLLVLSFCSLITGALSEETPCTIHDNGKFYDLNPLKASNDYQVQTLSGKTLSFNVCQSVKTDMFGLKDDVQAADVGGFVRRAHGDFSIGKVNATLGVSDSKPRLTMSNGSNCKTKAGTQAGDLKASSVIEFVCDSLILGSGTPRLVAELPPGDEEAACAYVLEWKTRYACPTSEGGGFWGFLGTLAVIFLVLLMAYTLLGTLYNRFVLDLRGFDQIPQFSVESMKYHGKEAYEWTRDMIGIVVLNLGSGSSYSGLSSDNSRTPNPVSHQAQVSGFGPAEDIEEGGGIGNGGGLGNGGGFIRPQASRNRSAAFQRHETNPVSHQSQVAQSLSFSSSTLQAPPIPQPQQLRDVPTKRQFGAESGGSTKEEREFMLGDDEDDAEELVDVKAPPPPAEKPATPKPSSAPVPGPQASASDAASVNESAAAAARGRNLGDGEATLL